MATKGQLGPERVPAGSTDPPPTRQDGRGRDRVDRHRVLVIGAGIAGLTAAHELALRGFDVVVVESEPDDRTKTTGPLPRAPGGDPLEVKLGGLAASQFRPLDDKASADRLRPFFKEQFDDEDRVDENGDSIDPYDEAREEFDDLVDLVTQTRREDDDTDAPLIVGEHGFRFFPAYYLHLFDTLGRIPLFDRDGEPTHRTVYDNIVEVSSQAVSITDRQPSLIFPRRPPGSLSEHFAISQQLRDVGIIPTDIEKLINRISRYLATSAERRTNEFEGISAYEYFVGLDESSGRHRNHYSLAVENLLRNMPRVLAAFNSRYGDARTNISTYLQLQLRMSEEDNKADGVLNGPTTTQWFDHWWMELKRLGVQFRRETIKSFDLFYQDAEHPDGVLLGHELSREQPALYGDDIRDHPEDCYQRAVLGVDEELRRRFNDALLGAVRQDAVIGTLRAVLADDPLTQDGVIWPPHLLDQRVVSHLVELLLFWFGFGTDRLDRAADDGRDGTTPNPRDERPRIIENGSWLVHDRIFELLIEALDPSPAPFAKPDSKKQGEDTIRSVLAYLETRFDLHRPDPQTVSTTRFGHAKELFDSRLEATDRTTLDDAITRHAKAARAVPVAISDRGRHVLHDSEDGFDYCILAVPAHRAEDLTKELRLLGVGGAVAELGGYATSAPPDVGPLEPREHRTAKGKADRHRDPLDMKVLGSKPWDRFQTLAGIQYYFSTEFQLARGHVYYADSEWALSSINQQGLWERRPNLGHDGYVSVLSVDIGDWNRPVPIRVRRAIRDENGKVIKVITVVEELAAKDCTRDELAQEVWRQICESLLGDTGADVVQTPGSNDVRRWADRLPRPLWYAVDRNIRYDAAQADIDSGERKLRSLPHRLDSDGKQLEGFDHLPVRNRAPYLVPIVGDWFNRPGGFPWNPHGTSMVIRPTEWDWRADLRDSWTWQARHGGYQVHLGNRPERGGLVFAGHWCKTFTRMTTMEAACESGRHAVNAILDHFLWVRTDGQREAEQRPLIRPPESSPLEHMTGPVRHPTAKGDYCFVFDIENREPIDFRPTRLLDRRYFFDDRPHPWELLGPLSYGQDSAMPLNPLSPEYMEWLTTQLRNWRSLLEGLSEETRPGRRPGRDHRGPEDRVALAQDPHHPDSYLFEVPGSGRIYEFRAYATYGYEEHLATAFTDPWNPGRQHAGFDSMGRRLGSRWGSL